MTFLPALPFAALFHSTFFSFRRHLQILMPRDKVLEIVTTKIKITHLCKERTSKTKQMTQQHFFCFSIDLLTCKGFFTLNGNRFPWMRFGCEWCGGRVPTIEHHILILLWLNTWHMVSAENPMKRELRRNILNGEEVYSDDCFNRNENAKI